MNELRIQVRLRRYFVSGFFILIPMGLSIVVVWWLVFLIDATLAPVVDAALGWHLPGLGLVTAITLIMAAGALASHVAGERVFGLAEGVLMRLPVFKWVYSTIKQMTEAFSPENGTSFKSVVIVEHPRPGFYSLGFVTKEVVLGLADGSSKALVSVYIPTNHVYLGDVVLVPQDQVIATTISIQQGIQSVLSAGATLPDHIGPKAKKES